MADMAAVKVLKNALCFIMGVFGCHGNTCYVILIGAFFCMIHSTGPINCVPILRSIGTKLTNLENMQRIVFYLKSRDAQTVRRTSWGAPTLLIKNILKPTRNLYSTTSGSKVMAQTVVYDFGDLDL